MLIQVTLGYYSIIQITTGFYRLLYFITGYFKWLQIKQFSANSSLNNYQGGSFEEYLVKDENMATILRFLQPILYSVICLCATH